MCIPYLTLKNHILFSSAIAEKLLLAQSQLAHLQIYVSPKLPISRPALPHPVPSHLHQYKQHPSTQHICTLHPPTPPLHFRSGQLACQLLPARLSFGASPFPVMMHFDDNSFVRSFFFLLLPSIPSFLAILNPQPCLPITIAPSIAIDNHPEPSLATQLQFSSKLFVCLAVSLACSCCSFHPSFI